MMDLLIIMIVHSNERDMENQYFPGMECEVHTNARSKQVTNGEAVTVVTQAEKP